MTDIGESLAHAQTAGGNGFAVDQNRHMFAGVVGTGPSGIAAMIGSEDQDVVRRQQVVDLRQHAVEIFQRGGIPRRISAMTVTLVEVDKVGHHDAEV